MAARPPDEFAPFVPRRVERASQAAPPAVAAAASADGHRDAQPGADTTGSRDEPHAHAPALPPRVDGLPPVERPESGVLPSAFDVRERAIQLAGVACARALHEAIARNPLFVTRFVDDALTALGDAAGAHVRLSSRDAAACARLGRSEIAADDGLQPGEVVVTSTSGVVRATIEARAQRLVRAAADG